MDLPQGIYELVVSKAIDEALIDIENGNQSVERIKIPFDDSPDVMSRYMQQVIRKGLDKVKSDAKSQCSGSDSQKESAAIHAEIDACNRIIDLLSEVSDDEDIREWRIGENGERLQSIWDKVSGKHGRPRSSLAVSTLFTGGRHDISLSDELCKEIETADEVGFLVSFIKISGIRLIIDSLEKFTRNGGRLRILTTTYMGATDPLAIDRLSKLPNTEVKISYDSHSTRLHAKSYYFKRRTGFSTVFIGSSNLSNAAISDGMEWNIKITNQDAPQIVAMVDATLESYWNSDDFEYYDPETGAEKLEEAINRERYSPGQSQMMIYDWKPHPFQREILDELDAEREVYGSYRNLVIAATGTGKTVISAFDYKRFREDHPDSDNVLYVAHRKEILERSLATFRSILGDQNFGRLYVGNYKTNDLSHVFMSIDSLESIKLDSLVKPDFYDYIVVDETHHGAAKSYQTLLTYFKPKILLGLTATPERMDGKDILQYFNDRIAAEIRLPEAINRELLVPFHYFMVTDPVDISKVKFTRGKYDAASLDALYNGNAERVEAIVNALNKYQPDIDSIVGLGFCVSKEHARYMAETFNSYGIASEALTSDYGDRSKRDEVQNRLVRKEIHFIFTVDLYNEGVDIKQVNTVLFLRPTDSMTVFIQQLGRGLRTCENKTELTVLDFVGQANNKYRMNEQKIRYLTSMVAAPVAMQVEKGFCGLPCGCNLKIEEMAKEFVLSNIKANKKNGLIENVKTFLLENHGDADLKMFLKWYDLDLFDVYKKKCTFTGLCRDADSSRGDVSKEKEKLFSRAFMKFATADSKKWMDAVMRILEHPERKLDSLDQIYAMMMYYTFYDISVEKAGYGSFEGFLEFLMSEKDYLEELKAIISIRSEHLKVIGIDPDLGYESGLEVYCSYYRDQILVALGKNSFDYKYPWREGVLYVEEKETDVFLINLNKMEKDFSPSTMYEDYAINDRLFHWQSQSTTSDISKTGRRYIEHDSRGSKVILFARVNKDVDGVPMPYIFLGKGHYVSHEGSKPMSIVWRMENKMPLSVTGYSPVGN